MCAESSFLRRAQQGLQRSSSAIDAPIGRLPLRLFVFFLSLSFSNVTLAFQKVCAGFSGKQSPAGSARDNFRNVHTPACLSPTRRPDPTRFSILFFGRLTFKRPRRRECLNFAAKHGCRALVLTGAAALASLAHSKGSRPREGDEVAHTQMSLRSTQVS